MPVAVDTGSCHRADGRAVFCSTGKEDKLGLHWGLGAAMNHARGASGSIVALGVSVLMGITPLTEKHPAQPIAEPTKLGFSYLSPAQLKELWRLAGQYALAEAFLKQCGAPSHIERRMQLAVRDCIEARALSRVASYFRKKMAEHGAKYTFVCDTDQSKALIKSTRAKIDAAVAEVRSMCRACLFC